jgi:hypothetical protein
MDALAAFGLSSETISVILGQLSDFVWESDPKLWSTEVPSTESFAANAVKMVVNMSQAKDLTAGLVPLMAAGKRMRDVKARIGYRDMDANTRDACDALLMACPEYDFSAISAENIDEKLKAHFNGRIHFVIDKLLP